MSGKVNLFSLIARLSNAHCLKDAPASYVNGFVAAAQDIYPANQIENILQHKFFVPDDAEYKLDAYLQSAAELSVQNHLRTCADAKNFEIEKEVNPPKDVDAYYEVGNTRVSLEVKCPEEEEISPESLVVKTVGRVPDHLSTFRKLKEGIEHPGSSNRLELVKNKDNTMKDFLLSANGKFSQASGVDDLNVLFVACGNEGNVQDWWHYLYGGEGLFTQESFLPSEQFQLVDVVLLSNLKYWHSDARQYHDWTLQNAFLLPCVNPHGRRSLVSEAMRSGLHVFDHHLTRFANYTPKPGHPHRADGLERLFRVGHYIVRHLDASERTRYFPVKPRT